MLRLALEKAVRERLVLGEDLVRSVISNKLLIVRATIGSYWQFGTINNY